MIILTSPDGEQVYMRDSSISLIQPVIPGLYARGTKSIVLVDSVYVAVKETPQQVLEKLGGAF